MEPVEFLVTPIPRVGTDVGGNLCSTVVEDKLPDGVNFFGSELEEICASSTTWGLESEVETWHASGGFGVLWGSHRPAAYAAIKVAQS